jgi:hypothetical protein
VEVLYFFFLVLLLAAVEKSRLCSSHRFTRKRNLINTFTIFSRTKWLTLTVGSEA